MNTSFNTWKTASLSAVWGVALVLVLKVHELPGDFGHSVCGPWGCGPPLPALVAMHGFWLVLLSLPVGLCCWFLTPRWLMSISLLAVVLGIVGIAGVVVWEAEHWLPKASELQRDAFLQRCLFSVGTMTDIPMVQIMFAGLVGSVCAWWKGAAFEKLDEVPEHPVRHFDQFPLREQVPTRRDG